MSSHSEPVRTLPSKPSFAQLRKQAKELLHSYLAREDAAVAEVERLERSPDPAKFALADAQRVLARGCGFSSWPALKNHVDGLNLAALLPLVQATELSIPVSELIGIGGILRIQSNRPDCRGTKTKDTDMNDTSHHDERIARMTFATVYPLYVAKVERKGRTQAELHQVIAWLTGFNERTLQKLIKDEATFEQFFEKATLNPNAHLITGVICGYRIEKLENPLTQKVRYMDKLVDELAKGREMARILRAG